MQINIKTLCANRREGFLAYSGPMIHMVNYHSLEG